MFHDIGKVAGVEMVAIIHKARLLADTEDAMIPASPDWTAIIAALPEPGFVILPNFIPSNLCQALRDELRTQDQRGAFHAAGVSRGHKQVVETRIRGDRIAWLQHKWPAASAYLALIDDLRETLNRQCFLGLAEYEAHYACYDPGSFYRRHIDRHDAADAERSSQLRSQRVLSTVCYLNDEDWQAADGGQLLMFPPGERAVPVLPLAGTLVLFRSELIPHEVLAATRQRLSIAGWLRTHA